MRSRLYSMSLTFRQLQAFNLKNVSHCKYSFNISLIHAFILSVKIVLKRLEPANNKDDEDNVNEVSINEDPMASASDSNDISYNDKGQDSETDEDTDYEITKKQRRSAQVQHTRTVHASTSTIASTSASTSTAQVAGTSGVQLLPKKRKVLKRKYQVTEKYA